jgi:hypothetical protein
LSAFKGDIQYGPLFHLAIKPLHSCRHMQRVIFDKHRFAFSGTAVPAACFTDTNKVLYKPFL